MMKPGMSYDTRLYQSTHTTGGAIMGSSPANSVINKYSQSWDVSNLFVYGASAFPQNIGYNPTGLLAGLAYSFWPPSCATPISKTSRPPGGRMRRWLVRSLLIVVVGFGLLVGVSWWSDRSAGDDSLHAFPPTPDLITRGAYLAKLGDCAACHSIAGQPEFSGGLRMVTPIGAIYSSNITPDPEHGIGRAIRWPILIARYASESPTGTRSIQRCRSPRTTIRARKTSPRSTPISNEALLRRPFPAAPAISRFLFRCADR